VVKNSWSLDATRWSDDSFSDIRLVKKSIAWAVDEELHLIAAARTEGQGFGDLLGPVVMRKSTKLRKSEPAAGELAPPREAVCGLYTRVSAFLGDTIQMIH
jgi:hypothetical protein